MYWNIITKQKIANESNSIETLSTGSLEHQNNHRKDFCKTFNKVLQRSAKCSLNLKKMDIIKYLNNIVTFDSFLGLKKFEIKLTTSNCQESSGTVNIKTKIKIKQMYLTTVNCYNFQDRILYMYPGFPRVKIQVLNHMVKLRWVKIKTSKIQEIREVQSQYLVPCHLQKTQERKIKNTLVFSKVFFYKVIMLHVFLFFYQKLALVLLDLECCSYSLEWYYFSTGGYQQQEM